MVQPPRASLCRVSSSLVMPIAKTQRLCNTTLVTRPARKNDPELTERVRAHMAACGLSVSALAANVNVHKATLSRSLAQGAFSNDLRLRLESVALPEADACDRVRSLHKALRLMLAADRLRERAGRLLIDALDQSTASK